MRSQETSFDTEPDPAPDAPDQTVPIKDVTPASVWHEEWVKWVAVGFVAVMLAGLGSVVAANFAPSPGDEPALAATGTVVPEEAAVPPTEPTATVPVTPTTGVPTPSATPGALVTSQSVVDLGDSAVEAAIEITNTGESTSIWSLGGGDGVISAEPASGELAPGEAQTVGLTLNREVSAEGEQGEELTLDWVDGEAAVFVQWSHMVNPLIIRPSANPETVLAQTGSNCAPDSSTITVRVTDDSEIDRVVVSWVSDGAGTIVETEMTAVDEENWRAVIGPFPVVVEPRVKVVAWDIHENAGGAPIALAVVGCS